MSCNATLVLTLLCTVACCSGGNITAYVKETLTSTTCETVTRIRSVCNVAWEVTRVAAYNYDKHIKEIKERVYSGEIDFGLNASDAIDCRKQYESMLCGNYFPVCDSKKLTIDYGDGTARCELANKACRTIYISGCNIAENGERSMVIEKNKCIPIEADTSKICPHYTMKIPRASTSYIGTFVKYLSDTADSFDEKTKNVTDMASCAKKYKEVLCRLIRPCSPDGVYSLFLIGKEECEEKMSCTEKYDHQLKVDASMCAMLPNVDSYQKLIVKNPSDEDTTETLKERNITGKASTTVPRYSTKNDSLDVKETSTTVPAYFTKNDGRTTDSFNEVKDLIEPTNSTISNNVNPENSRKGSAGNMNLHFLWFTMLFSTIPLLVYHIPW